jgi:hypothetical protein
MYLLVLNAVFSQLVLVILFFREGGVYFLQRLHEEKIPLLVFSAGIGGE